MGFPKIIASTATIRNADEQVRIFLEVVQVFFHQPGLNNQITISLLQTSLAMDGLCWGFASSTPSVVTAEETLLLRFSNFQIFF